MKIIILADGEGKRWGNYKGVPKQLLRIDGETLLDRMIRQFKEYEDSYWCQEVEHKIGTPQDA